MKQPLMSLPNFGEPVSIFDLLNFRLAEFLGISGSLITRICEGEFGVTREQWQLVAMLGALGQLSPSDLAGLTTLDRSQCSRTLRVLTAKKLVDRQRVDGDGRRALVSLSTPGKQLYEALLPRVIEVHHAVLANLDASELQTLAGCLLKIQQAAIRVESEGLVGSHADRRQGGSRASWPRVPLADR